MIKKLFIKIIKITKIKWLKSAYINLRVLPLGQAIKFPIIVKGKLKIRSLSGRIKINGNVRFGILNIGHDVDNMPISMLPSQILIKGELILNGDVILNQGANLVVWPNALLELGNDVMICGGVTLKAVNKVSIGDHTMISAGCFIMDSSIHCIYNTEDTTVPSSEGEIRIGNNVWLNMYTDVIKRGEIPNGCITARYTLINKPIDSKEENCFLAGQPAKVIKRNVSQLHNFTSEKYVHRWYNDTSDKLFLTTDLVTNENLCRKITKI